MSHYPNLQLARMPGEDLPVVQAFSRRSARGFVAPGRPVLQVPGHRGVRYAGEYPAAPAPRLEEADAPETPVAGHPGAAGRGPGDRADVWSGLPERSGRARHASTRQALAQGLGPECRRVSPTRFARLVAQGLLASRGVGTLPAWEVVRSRPGARPALPPRRYRVPRRATRLSGPPDDLLTGLPLR